MNLNHDDEFEQYSQGNYHDGIPPNSKIESYSKSSENHITRKCQYRGRWDILLYAFPSIITAFFCYDLPAALHDALIDELQDVIEQLSFNLYFIMFYILYTIATIILPIITGGIRDVKGDRYVLTLLGYLVIIGQVTFAIGVYEKSVCLIIIGRLVLCWGVESMIPIYSSFLSQYFREKNISSVLSTVLFCSVFGLILSMTFGRLILGTYGLNATLLTGAMFALMGHSLLLISIRIDKHVDEVISQLNYYAEKIPQFNKQNIIDLNNELQNVAIQQSSIIMLSEQDQEKTFFVKKLISNIIYFHQPQNILRLQDILTYPYMFWLLLLFNVFFYCSIILCVTTSLNIFTELFFTDQSENYSYGRKLSQIWAWGCILLPFMGYFFDKLGSRPSFAIVSSIILIIGNILYVQEKLIGIFLMGVAFSLHFSAVWSCIVFLIKPNALGKAYGLIISFQNLGFAILPIFLLLNHINTRQDIVLQKSIIILAILPLIVTFLILKEDIHQGGMLDKGFVTVMIKPSLQHMKLSNKYGIDEERASSIYNQDTYVDKIRESMQENIEHQEQKQSQKSQ